MNYKIPSHLTEHGPAYQHTVLPPAQGTHRIIVGLGEAVIYIGARLNELLLTRVVQHSLSMIQPQLHYAARQIAVATALQVVAGAHRRHVSDHIVQDLIANEVQKACDTVADFSRDYLMGVASDIQHCGEMATSRILVQVIPEIDNPSYCRIIGYCAYPTDAPHFTVDVMIYPSNRL